MIEKKNFLKNFLYSLAVFFIFLTISLYLVNYFNINRHWTNNYDQEFTLAYNALLFNSGILQEFLVHSGYFTILFLSFFVLLAKLFQFIDFYNISGLINFTDIDNALQNLISITRIYVGISLAAWCGVINIIFYYFSKSKIYSLFLSLILITFPGTFFHGFELRTELVSSLLMILSFFAMLRYLNSEYYKNSNTNLFFFFIFIYSAILNKSQIFFYFFGIIILCLFFYKKINKIDLKLTNNFSKKYFYYTFIIIFLYLFLKLSIYPGTSYFSLVFIMSNIILLNLIFYNLAKREGIETLNFLTNFDIILILSFLSLKLILFFHPSTNELAFINTIINIMGISKYSIYAIENNGNLNDLVDLFSLFFLHLKKVFIYYFSEINIYNILIAAIIILSLIFKKKIGNKFFLFNIFCILVPLSFAFISSFKDIQIVYHIFWDYIFLLPFCIFYKKVSFNINLIVMLLFIPILIYNFTSFKNFKISIDSKSNLNSAFEVCNDLDLNKENYLEAFHKKIPTTKFNEFCGKIRN